VVEPDYPIPFADKGKALMVETSHGGITEHSLYEAFGLPSFVSSVRAQ